MIFSEKLKTIRESRKWSMKTMSCFLYKTPYPTYVRWEKGKPPSIQVQCMILHILMGRAVSIEEMEELIRDGVE